MSSQSFRVDEDQWRSFSYLEFETLLCSFCALFRSSFMVGTTWCTTTMTAGSLMWERAGGTADGFGSPLELDLVVQ